MLIKDSSVQSHELKLSKKVWKMFKVHNNDKKRRHSVAFIIKLEHISSLFPVIQLLTWSMYFE